VGTVKGAHYSHDVAGVNELRSTLREDHIFAAAPPRHPPHFNLNLVNEPCTMHKTAARILPAVFVTVALLPTPSQAGTPREFHRSTQAGQEVEIAWHEHHDGRCRPASDPEITITASPAHGRVEIRPETHEITARPVTGATLCIGTVIRAVGVWYIPRADFHGTETFTYDETIAPALFNVTVTVDVK
jgi:hypothetical protein